MSFEIRFEGSVIVNGSEMRGKEFQIEGPACRKSIEARVVFI